MQLGDVIECNMEGRADIAIKVSCILRSTRIGVPFWHLCRWYYNNWEDFITDDDFRVGYCKMLPSDIYDR